MIQMSFENDKLTKFTSTILNDAKVSSDKILQEIDKEREQQLSKAKSKIECEFEHYIRREQEKIKSAAETEISKRSQENKKQLALTREKISSSVLQKVREKIVEFTNSDKYEAYLKKQLDKAFNLMPEEGPFVLEARSCDIDKLKELITKSFEVSSYNTIDLELGGFILSNRNQNMHANMTLDLAFKELSGHVYKYIDLNYER